MPRLGSPVLGVRMIGIGGSVPPTIVKNDALTQLVDTSDEWITTRTGIRERRILAGDENLTGLCVEASKQALLSAGLTDASSVGLIIVATSTSDERYPATAARLQDALNAPHAFGFDLSLACTGFVAALTAAEQYLRSGLVKRALVVGADAHSRVMDWTDRNTCILFGDGAGACLLEASEEQDDFYACDSHLDGGKASELFADNVMGHCPLVAPPSPKSPYVQMNGREVFKFAVSKVPQSILATLEKASLPIAELDFLVLHQANARIMQAMKEKLGLRQEQLLMNLDRYGNTSAASIPLVINEGVLNGEIKPGHTLLVCGFGGGLSWSSSLFRWTHADMRLSVSS